LTSDVTKLGVARGGLPPPGDANEVEEWMRDRDSGHGITVNGESLFWCHIDLLD